MTSIATILVLDLGTSRIKASLFSPEGQELPHANADYPTYAPRPGWAEQLPADWWAATLKTVRSLWAQGAVPSDVRMISVTGQMHGVVPVDDGGRALGPCLTLRDRRAVDEAAQLRREISEEKIYKISGARLDASSPPAKFLWYRRNRPDLWSAAHVFLAPKDWLRQQLTGGEPVTDPVEAAGMALYNVTQARWSPEMAAACQTPLDRLPIVRSPVDLAGRLSKAAAESLGLEPGCPVIVGCADDVEFVGAGLIDPGDCLEHLGSTGSLLAVVNHPVDDPTGTLELYPYPAPGRWVVGGSTSSAGAALDWLREVLGLDTPLQMPAVQSIAPPIFMPYLAGERCPIWEPNARGMFWGLGMEHRQTDLVQAAFEGVAFSLRHLLDTLSLSGGLTPGEIRTAPSTDLSWLCLRASVYDRPLRIVKTHDPTALGAALVAACALGVFANLEQAMRAVIRLGDQIQPQSSEMLSTRYATYLRVSTLIQKFVSEA